MEMIVAANIAVKKASKIMVSLCEDPLIANKQIGGSKFPWSSNEG